MVSSYVRTFMNGTVPGNLDDEFLNRKISTTSRVLLQLELFSHIRKAHNKITKPVTYSKTDAIPAYESNHHQ